MALCRAQQTCRIILITRKTPHHLAQELNLLLQNMRNPSSKRLEYALLHRRNNKNVNIPGPRIRIRK